MTTVLIITVRLAMEMIVIQYLEHWTPWTILYRDVVLYALNTLFRGRKTRYFRRELCNIEKKKVSKIFVLSSLLNKWVKVKVIWRSRYSMYEYEYTCKWYWGFLVFSLKNSPFYLSVWCGIFVRFVVCFSGYCPVMWWQSYLCVTGHLFSGRQTGHGSLLPI